MLRGDHWWNEPPWWAWVTMLVSLVAIIVMLPFALNREPPEADISTGAARTSEPSRSTSTAPGRATTSAAETSPADEDVSQVLVLGDADTAGTGAGGGWPALLEERFPDVEMTVATTGEAGYVTTGAAADATIPELLEDVDLTGVDVVVLFGSRYDAPGIADLVNLAAGTVIGAIDRQAPEAELVVIGPAWPGASPPAGIRNNRDVIRSAAETVGATFVDPIADGWLADAPETVAPDGQTLTEAADVYLADRIEPLVREALAA